MVKVTLEVLHTKLESMHSDLKDMKTEQKLNTEFRQKATGIIGFATVMAGVFGAAIVWVGGKLVTLFTRGGP